MGNPEIKAGRRTGPWYKDGDTNTSVRYVTVSTTHGQYAVPADWRGQYATLQAEGADVYFFFSDDPDAEVSSSATSGATLGWKIANGEKEDWYIPTRTSTLIHEGSASGVLRMVLSSTDET